MVGKRATSKQKKNRERKKKKNMLRKPVKKSLKNVELIRLQNSLTEKMLL